MCLNGLNLKFVLLFETNSGTISEKFRNIGKMTPLFLDNMHFMAGESTTMATI